MVKNIAGKICAEERDKCRKSESKENNFIIGNIHQSCKLKREARQKCESVQ